MRRTLFFIVAVCLATSSFASIPRASTFDLSSPRFDALPETRIRVSEVLAPFQRPAPSQLSLALHQAYAELSTTNASGLARFLSVDPGGADPKRPQTWNRYAYVENNPINKVDPDGRVSVDAVIDIGSMGYGIYDMWATVLSGRPVTASQNLAVAVDLGAVFLPGVTGAGSAVRTAALADNVADVKRVVPYEVGRVDDLAKRSKGDNIEIHHAPQKHPAGQAIPGYDAKTAPGIALPKGEHRQIPTQKGPYAGTPRDLVAKDIRDLRNHTNAPNSALQKLVRDIKDAFGLWK